MYFFFFLKKKNFIIVYLCAGCPFSDSRLPRKKRNRPKKPTTRSEDQCRCMETSGPWVDAPDRMGSRASDWLCGMPCRIGQNLRAGLEGSGRWLVRISRSEDAKIFARRDDSQLNEYATRRVVCVVSGGMRLLIIWNGEPGNV